MYYIEQGDDNCFKAFISCVWCSGTLLICSCFLMFWVGAGLLLGFGIDNLVMYSSYTETVCNATETTIGEGFIRIGTTFEIQNIVMRGSFALGCTNCESGEGCYGQEEYCEDIADDYPPGQQFVCYWYPSAREINIYNNLNGPGIAMTIIGGILLLCPLVCRVRITTNET